MINLVKKKTYFTIDEMCRSYTAQMYNIDNTPDETIVEHLYELIDVLNPLREAWGSAIRVTSGYRCEKLNELVGGVKTSMHKKGYAADLYPANGKIKEFKKFVVEYLKNKDFDQCILER